MRRGVVTEGYLILKGCRWTLAGSSWQRAFPRSGHPADFIDFLGDEKMLLHADPTPVSHKPPQHPELFPLKVELIQDSGLCGGGREDATSDKHDAVQHDGIQLLTKRKSMGLREVRGSVKGPTEEFHNERVDGWTSRGG